MKAPGPFALQEQQPRTIWRFTSISFCVTMGTKWLKINKTEAQQGLLAISHGDEQATSNSVVIPYSHLDVITLKIEISAYQLLSVSLVHAVLDPF